MPCPGLSSFDAAEATAWPEYREPGSQTEGCAISRRRLGEAPSDPPIRPPGCRLARCFEEARTCVEVSGGRALACHRPDAAGATAFGNYSESKRKHRPERAVDLRPHGGGRALGESLPGRAS